MVWLFRFLKYMRRFVLTHLCRMEFPIVVNLTSLFPFLGCCVVFFLCIQILKETTANSGEPDQTPPFAASDLGLHCWAMSHKKDARLIWVNVSNACKW